MRRSIRRRLRFDPPEQNLSFRARAGQIRREFRRSVNGRSKRVKICKTFALVLTGRGGAVDA